jgi:hypothetical protein
VHSPAEAGRANGLELGYGGDRRRVLERQGLLGGPRLRLGPAKLGDGQHARWFHRGASAQPLLALLEEARTGDYAFRLWETGARSRHWRLMRRR